MMPRLTRTRALPPLLLALFALAYYGFYFRCGFTLQDDGSVALLSQRLMQGDRPYVDLQLGYNILWFYPIAGLFKIFGVHFLLVRIWFFFLATLSGLVAWRLVDRVSGRWWLASLVGAAVILAPGTSNKTYIPLLILSTSLCLAEVLLALPSTRRLLLWAGFGGAVLALAFLIRTDLALFLLLLWIGTLALLPLLVEKSSRARLFIPVGAVTAFAFSFVVATAPFYLDARKRGFDEPLVRNYFLYAQLIRSSLASQLAPPAPPPAPQPGPPAPSSSNIAAVPAEVTANRQNKARRPISQIWKAKRLSRRALVFLTYAPLLSLSLLILWFTTEFLVGIFTGATERIRDSLLALVVTGAALTAFPQYFFYRPDTAHISEFMPGCLAALTVGGTLLATRAASGWRQMAAWAVIVVAIFHAGVYLPYALTQRSAGTIAAWEPGLEFFNGRNGMKLYLPPETAGELRAMEKVISENTLPGEYLITYPYSPGINFLTGLPTYQTSLYVDNVTRSSDFDAFAIRSIEQYRPAVIAIDDWAINGTRDSKFSVWARETYEYIRDHYDFHGEYLEQQIYLRRP